MQATGGDEAAQTSGESQSGRERQILAAALFAMVGLVFVAAEHAFAMPVPSLAWLGLLAAAVLGGLEKVRIKKSPSGEAPTQALPTATPETTLKGPPEGDTRSAPETPAPVAVGRPAGPAAVLAAVSHEIRTPINAIVGFSELLRDAERNSTGQKLRVDYANLVLDNARQLQAVVNDVLEANRLNSSGFVLVEQDCDIGEIVEVATRDCGSEAEARGITMIAHVATGVAFRGDGARLRKAIACLVSNAIKFSPSDGLVNINMLRGHAGGLVIAITDAGAGLKQQDLERAFLPFSQIDEGTARQHGGLGLGLYISREIARLHGGDLEIMSQAGVGTEARLSLPATRVSFAGLAVSVRRVA